MRALQVRCCIPRGTMLHSLTALTRHQLSGQALYASMPNTAARWMQSPVHRVTRIERVMLVLRACSLFCVELTLKLAGVLSLTLKFRTDLAYAVLQRVHSVRCNIQSTCSLPNSPALFRQCANSLQVEMARACMCCLVVCARLLSLLCVSTSLHRSVHPSSALPQALAAVRAGW